jgi:hypothetical protein
MVCVTLVIGASGGPQISDAFAAFKAIRELISCDVCAGSAVNCNSLQPAKDWNPHAAAQNKQALPVEKGGICIIADMHHSRHNE